MASRPMPPTTSWKNFRAALRQEWFNDVDGVRTGTVDGVTLFSTTATLQYNIWKGLYSAASTGTTMPTRPSSAAGRPPAA